MGPPRRCRNAIFQVEYIERVIETDPLLARTELRYLRELLRRELGDVRAFISQLRPPLLDQLGLDGAITDTIDRIRTLTGADRSRPTWPRRPTPAQRRANRRSSCASPRKRCRMSASTPRPPTSSWRPGSTAATGCSRSATTAEGSTSERWPPEAGATSASSSCASEPS